MDKKAVLKSKLFIHAESEKLMSCAELLKDEIHPKNINAYARAAEELAESILEETQELILQTDTI